MFSISQYKHCSNCGNGLNLNLGFCEKCFTCKKCGNEIIKTDIYCEICGSKLFFERVKMFKEDEDLYMLFKICYKKFINFILRIFTILRR